MFFRASLGVEGWEEILNRLNNLDTQMFSIAGDVVLDLRPAVLAALQKVPGIPKSPFVWSNNPAANARARRWWFAAIKRGIIETENGHYKRTGNLMKGWDIDIKNKTDGVVLTVSNEAAKGIIIAYVYGSLSLDEGEAARFQLPGHVATGWPFASPIVSQFFNDFTLAFRAMLADYLGADTAL